MVMDRAIRKMRLPRSLKEATCRITSVSSTKMPPFSSKRFLPHDHATTRAPHERSAPMRHEYLRG